MGTMISSFWRQELGKALCSSVSSVDSDKISNSCSNEGVLASQVPFMAPTLTPSTFDLPSICYYTHASGSDTPYDWNYTVVPQTHLNGRTFPTPRGRILGGSSSISECTCSGNAEGGKLRVMNVLDYMIHHYGSSEDYDRLARITGDSGWAWKNMKRYIDRVGPNNSCNEHRSQTFSFSTKNL